MVHMKIHPKDLIGRDREMVRLKVRPKDLIGRDGNLVRMKVRPKDLIGRPTCMSCQSNLIGQSNLLSSGNAL